MMALSIKRIQIGVPASEYFLLTEEESVDGDNKKWNLYLLGIEQRKAFTGSTSERELRLKAAESPVETFKIYLSDTLCAFGCEESEAQSRIHYVLKEKSDSIMVFEWKKDVPNGMRVFLGDLEIHQKDFDSALVEILTMSSKEMLRSKHEIQQLNSDVDLKERDRLAIKTVLDETLEMKSNLENDLFSKFAKVLNSKKSKIRELYAEIESLKSSKKSKKSSLVKSSIHSRAEPMEEDINQPGPSKKKKDSQDSLLLSSDEEDSVRPKIKTGLRQRVRKQVKPEKITNGVKKNESGSFRPLVKDAVLKDTYEDIDDLFDDL